MISAKESNPTSENQKYTCIKINSTSETVDAQYELEKQRLNKKRELKKVQYDNYSKMFYGSPTEKELMKRDHRQALLDQVKQKELLQKEEFHNKVFESQAAAMLDQSCQKTDDQQSSSKSLYLKQFRDQNKQLMETRANDQRVQRAEEHRQERELLRYDPINWSKTLV